MWLTGPTRAQQSAWPMHKMTHAAETADVHGPVTTCNGLLVDEDLHG